MKIAMLSLFALVLAGPAQADLLGRYSLPGNGSLEIYYQDENNVRVGLPNQGYMLFTGDQMYMVMEQGGMRMAMDLKEMGGMVSGMRDQAIGKGTDPTQLVPQIEDSGRQETVAGYSGQVHKVTVGPTQTEMVLTKDPEVAKVTNAFLIAMNRLGDMLRPEDRRATAAAIEQLESTGYTGLLKQSDGVKLQGIEKVDRPDSFYQLPAGIPLIRVPMTQTPN